MFRFARRYVGGVATVVFALWGGAAFAQMPHLDGAALRIPAAAPGTPHGAAVDDLMSLRDMHGLTPSPDGRWAATLVNQPDVGANSYRFAWFVVDLRGGRRSANVGDAGEPWRFRAGGYELDRAFSWHSTTPARWAPDSRAFAYLRPADGAVQVWRSAVDGSRPRQLTHNAADVVDFRWSADGRRIVFATDAPRAALAAAVDHEERSGVHVDGTVEWSFAYNRPYRKPYALTGGRPVVWTLEVRTGKERPATVREAADLPSRAPNPGEEAALGDTPAPAGPAVARVESADEAPGQSYPRFRISVHRPDRQAPCPPGWCQAYFELFGTPSGGQRRVAWRRDGRVLYALLRRSVSDHELSLQAWSLEGAPQTLLTTRDTLTDCSVSDGNLICLRQTPTAPRTVASISLATGAITTFFDPNPEWRAVRLGKTDWVRWSDRDGRTSTGVLFEPVGRVPGRRYPLVVVGYGTDEAVRGDMAVRYPAHVLAAQGFYVLIYNIWNDETTQHQADRLLTFYRQLSDGVQFRQLDSEIQALVDGGLVDPDRIGVGGHSLGLDVVIPGIIGSRRFAAASFGWIRWTPGQYFSERDSFSAYFVDWLRPKSEADSFFLRDHSLACNAARITTPIMINASDTEYFQLGMPEAIRRFEDAGRPMDFYIRAHEGHIIFEPAQRDAELRRNLQWFEFWLQGKESDAPVDPGQYIRWRKMRSQAASPMLAGVEGGQQADGSASRGVAASPGALYEPCG